MKYPRDVTLWDPLKARLIRSNWKKERRDRRLIIVRGINSRKKKLISYNSRKSNSIIPPRGLRKRSDPQWRVLSLSRRLLSTLRGLHHTHRNHCVQTNRFQTFLSLTSHNNNNVVKLTGQDSCSREEVDVSMMNALHKWKVKTGGNLRKVSYCLLLWDVKT